MLRLQRLLAKHLSVLGFDATAILAADRSACPWGDGFEIETLINIRVAAAGLAVAEVPSFERSRMYGVSNLCAFSDGIRVLCTILYERFIVPRQGQRSLVGRLLTRMSGAPTPSPSGRCRPTLGGASDSSARLNGDGPRSAVRQSQLDDLTSTLRQRGRGTVTVPDPQDQKETEFKGRLADNQE